MYKRVPLASHNAVKSKFYPKNYRLPPKHTSAVVIYRLLTHSKCCRERDTCECKRVRKLITDENNRRGVSNLLMVAIVLHCMTAHRVKINFTEG